MGSNLNEFVVRLEFSASGGIAKATYHDSEGCGHEKEMALDNDIRSMVQYHLDHYKRGHGMAPPRLCGFSVQIEGGGRLDCQKENHGGSEHVFTYDTR